MKNKIAFYGASVTQQANGYWEYFAKLNPNFDVKPFGNGSMHLNDAGICYIDDVINFQHSIIPYVYYGVDYVIW